MFSEFSHYLSYGSTDQQTVRDLASDFDGLVVPGTVAAVQSEGTKGFVLSLSAGSDALPYVIDSRFPLFQNRLAKPKKSHGMLAALFGLPDLVRSDRPPIPADFTPEVIRQVGEKWVDFNVGFEDVQSKAFEKYASRLQEEVFPKDRKDPTFIFPPYVMAESVDDEWWAVSCKLFEATAVAASGKGVAGKLRRVVATTQAATLGNLLSDATEAELVVWVSSLDEFSQRSESSLIEYGLALERARSMGKSTFALYGGFFAILLSRFGLKGASHGIGFGEHRDWHELPSSGAPPARFYVPILHRYIGVDIAVAIWRQFPELMQCLCPECGGASPADLDYHGLMRHSVRVRNAEILEWVGKPTADAVRALNESFELFKVAVSELEAPAKLRSRAQEIHLHLPMWARALDQIQSQAI